MGSWAEVSRKYENKERRKISEVEIEESMRVSREEEKRVDREENRYRVETDWGDQPRPVRSRGSDRARATQRSTATICLPSPLKYIG